MDWYKQAMSAQVLHMDGTEETVALECFEEGGSVIASFPELDDWSNIRSIDFAPLMGQAKSGDDGCYVIPHGENSLGDSILCRFRTREDHQMTLQRFLMPIWGVIHAGQSFLAVVSSMTYEYELTVSVKQGMYSCHPRFVLNGAAPYEPITVEYILLSDSADYSTVALSYRAWREKRGEIHRYANRMQGRPAAQYTAESIYIRIRQGWKPVPPLIREQTIENEPEMHVASTFEDVSELLDSLKAHGIDKAECCLVGWNKSGHDGRWPQAFPVEDKLGGEKALRRLTEKAANMGYAMVCHTNSTDAYSIADCWKDTDIITDQSGNRVKNVQPWSGGDMYQVCPLCGLRQARELLPKVRALGFSGTHYIDVITTVFPRACYDEKHPVTKREMRRFGIVFFALPVMNLAASVQKALLTFPRRN